MNTHFGSKPCPSCGKYIDAANSRCPHCGNNNGEEYRLQTGRAWPFEHFVQTPFYRQIIYFLVGWIGFQTIGTVASLFFGIHAAGIYGADTAAIEAYLKSAEVAFWINMIAYFVVFAALSLLLWKNGWKEIFHSFKNWKAPLIGLACLGATYGSNLIYTAFFTIIFKLAGIDMSLDSGNQIALIKMYSVMPWLFTVVIGVIGPFVEEMAYRVGLFSFLSRIRKWLAYLLTGIVFGLIHFKWAAIGTNDVFVELINLPSYIGAGLILSFAYDKGGFAASFTCHSLNNILSIIQISMLSGESA